jgi:hypothetical protein
LESSRSAGSRGFGGRRRARGAPRRSHFGGNTGDAAVVNAGGAAVPIAALERVTGPRAPAPAGSHVQRFRALALIYLVSNASYGSGANRRRLQRVMTRPEREAVVNVLERLPATVAGWSDGLAGIDPLDVVEIRRPLSSLSSSGPGQWWAGPRDCREELLELAAERRYDSVVVLWPAAPQVPLCGWGCTIGPSDATFGAGFTSIASDHWPTLATDPDPEQGYVHEWLHQVESIYRELGLGEDVLPNLHDAATYTSTRSVAEPPFGESFAAYHDGTGAGRRPGRPARPAARTWAPWYRDWMTGRLRRLDESAADSPALGLTPERWALRSGK